MIEARKTFAHEIGTQEPCDACGQPSTLRLYFSHDVGDTSGVGYLRTIDLCDACKAALRHVVS